MTVYVLSTSRGSVLGAYTTREKAQGEARRMELSAYVINPVSIDRPV